MRSTRTWKRRAAAFLAVAGVLVMSSGVALLATAGSATADPSGDAKVVVCKYVGKPGESRLQTGQNPIEVSVNTLKNLDPPWDGTFPWAWTDAQGQAGGGSIAIRYLGDTPGDISECPQPEVLTATADVTAVQPTCDDVNGSWTATATNATVTGSEGSDGSTTGAGVTTGDGVRNGSVTVSFAADDGAEFAGGETTATKTVTFGDVVPPEGWTFDEATGKCVQVSPPAAEATAQVQAVQPTCDDPNGSWTATATNATVTGSEASDGSTTGAGVTTGNGVRNGSVTVSFAATDGAEFAGGAATAQKTVTFGDVVPPEGLTFDEATGKCVQVSPPVKPPVVKPPTVKPPTVSPPQQPAAPVAQVNAPTVPTVVHAGLAGSPTSDPRGPQGMALLAAGALLLVAATALAGRSPRRSRAHR
ncbi:MAG TPA: hypothetical protein VFL69_16410 [Marmoricola sp.]|nr:hypothetical protein [Marmoricola sp.]